MIVVDFSLKEKKMKKWNLNEAKNFVNFIKKIVKVIKKWKIYGIVIMKNYSNRNELLY